ncbi:hypothetical protein MKX65_24385 [Robertmurraya sp. FSL R5-0851]|uniref:hypothetical protein n=1 Tax=Robertmurraya sp. FSL R5-0851 TaxID=2921584 RepID=UPI0030FC319B
MKLDDLTTWFWQIGVNFFLYALLIVITLWTSKNIMLAPLKDKYTQWNYRYRIRKIQSKTLVTKGTEYNNRFLRHLNLLIRTTREERNEFDVTAFLILSGLLGVSVGMFILISFGDILVSVIFGVLLSMIPYLFLRMRLSNIRFAMGEEFLSIVQELTQNYNAMHYDMYHALNETQKTVKNPVLRKVLVKLISDLQVSRNEQELKETIKVFTYTAGTSWSKRLGSIILKSYLYNEKVLNALMVLNKQMEETAEMLEEEHSQTLDHVYNGYLTLPVFFLALVLGYVTSGAQDWFKLQFGTSWTILLFSLSLIGVVFSLIISVFLKRPKNDL